MKTATFQCPEDQKRNLRSKRERLSEWTTKLMLFNGLDDLAVMTE